MKMHCVFHFGSPHAKKIYFTSQNEIYFGFYQHFGKFSQVEQKISPKLKTPLTLFEICPHKRNRCVPNHLRLENHVGLVLLCQAGKATTTLWSALHCFDSINFDKSVDQIGPLISFAQVFYRKHNKNR